MTDDIITISAAELGLQIHNTPKCQGLMSGYKWQLEALNSRLEHPEHYEKYEDVQEVIAHLKKWLAEHLPK